MRKNKNEDEKKRKLRTLILLLFLTIIMFGTSTYAWFTANRIVTINSLDVHVEASNGIQISTDGVNWKSVITVADITQYAYAAAINQVPRDVTAVSTIPVVNENSRLNMYSATVDTSETDGSYTIQTQLETDTKGTTGKYIVFDFFLKVDSPQPVYLTPSSNVTASGDDYGLKNSARVAFIPLGNTVATSDAATITGLNNPGTVILWEPNYDAHEDIIVTSIAPQMSVQLTQTNSEYNRVNYTGVRAATSSALSLKDVVNGTNTSITTAVTPTITTKETYNNYNVFASTLAAGITKYRTYMWIEGQDIDCDNSATGTDISFNVQLSTSNSSAASSSS